MVSESLNFNAAKIFAAVEIPPLMPVDVIFLKNSITSSSSTKITSSIKAKSKVLGIKPAPIP